MAVAARDLRKTFPATPAALRGVSFSVSDGETLALLGPSGAGKTTLLRIIAGLERADTGAVLIDDRDVTALAPDDRGAAIVFDRDGLFPHLSLEANLAFPLKLRGVRASTIQTKVRDSAMRLELAAHLAKKPAALSAGERQRAALARAVLCDPRVLLLDEPLAHLDPSLRARLRRDFGDFAHEFPGAVIAATHDHAEAFAMGDRLAILIDGELVQCDRPERVYEYPQTTAVAAFLGSPPMNLIEDGDEIIGIRAERVALNGSGFSARVVALERTGADMFLRLQSEGGMIVARVDPDEAAESGREVRVSLPERHVRRFDKTTGKLKS